MSIAEMWNAKSKQTVAIENVIRPVELPASVALEELEYIAKNNQDIAMLQHVIDTVLTCQNNFETVVNPSLSYECSVRTSKQSHELTTDDIVIESESKVLLPMDLEDLLSSLKLVGSVSDVRGFSNYISTLTGNALKNILNSLKAFVMVASTAYLDATPYLSELSAEITRLFNGLSSVDESDRLELVTFIKTFGEKLAKDSVNISFVNDYWDAVANGYTAAVTEIVSAYNSFKEDITLASISTQVLQSCSSILQNLFSYITSPGEASGGINYIDETALYQMTTNVEDILRLLSFLSTDEQSVIQEGLDKFFQTSFRKIESRSTGVVQYINSADILASVWVYKTLNAMVVNDPNITLNELKTRLDTEFQPFADLLPSFITNYQSAINSFKALSIIPNSGSPYPLVSFLSGKAKMNADFLPSMIQVPSEDSPILGVFIMVNNVTNVAASISRLDAALSAINTNVIQAQNLANQRVAVLQNIESLKSVFEIDKQKAIAVAMKSKPLPSALVTLLLDNYMPGEEQYLQGLVSELNSSNYGAQIGNDFLQNLLSYLNASTTFTFGSYLGSPTDSAGTLFSGSASSANAHLTDEKTALQNMLKDTLTMLDLLSTYRTQITDSTGLSTVQKKGYFLQLQQYENSLRKIVSQATLVGLFLENIVITPPDPKSNSGIFTVKWDVSSFLLYDKNKWLKRLLTAESVVSSGKPGETVPGGMTSFYAQVHADQQSAADSGQSVQLNLQMQLTAMQQQWSVVATALQVLNQVYLAIARSLVG